MKNVSTLFIALSLVTLAGCPGDDGGSDGTETATPTTMTGATGTAGDDDGMPTTAGDDDGMPTTAGDDDGVDDGMMTTAGDDTTGGGGGAGFCGLTCKAPADCLPGGVGNEKDWECTDGFCASTLPPIDPCDPMFCPEAAGYMCLTVDGADACGLPCPNGDECDALMQECTGMDDAGAAFCQAPPCGGVAEGEACDIPMFGQIGTCTDGVCSCTADTECTAEGYGCNLG